MSTSSAGLRWDAQAAAANAVEPGRGGRAFALTVSYAQYATALRKLTADGRP